MGIPTTDCCFSFVPKRNFLRFPRFRHTGPHLPPLGRNQQQSLVSYPTRHLITKAAHRTTASGLSRADQVGNDWPGSGPERAVVADVFVQAGQAAGIAFHWVETPTAGLSVVGVADGSVAARHGGVTAGMLLVEINRQRIAGMEQGEVTRIVRTASTQPRVLTLARIAPSTVATAHRGSHAETKPEDTIVAATDESLTLDSPLAMLSSIAGAGQTSVTFHQPLSHQYILSSGPRPVSSSSDVDMPSANSSRTTSSSATNPSAETALARTGSRHLVSQERTLTLRFVGSRGDITLFDRDHVLGLAKRDIEFVPSGSRSKMLTNNSRRSLGELTRDWRNDPCSTPARRRRLINEVCKVIVRSYTHASVLRVTELRREEMFATRIQAAARMRSARSRYTAKLAERRRRGAVTLQLGWLSYRARRWVAVLRDERDHAIRADEVKRKIGLAREKQARNRCEEARRLAEEAEMEREKRCREQQLVVLLQRRYRARKASCATSKIVVSKTRCAGPLVVGCGRKKSSFATPSQRKSLIAGSSHTKNGVQQQYDSPRSNVPARRTLSRGTSVGVKPVISSFSGLTISTENIAVTQAHSTYPLPFPNS